MSAERERIDGFGRLEDGLLQAGGWYLWGPYVSERQWGTVREDYSADGEAWAYLPHDHARSRAYRWGEDGLAGRGHRSCAAGRLVPQHMVVGRRRPETGSGGRPGTGGHGGASVPRVAGTDRGDRAGRHQPGHAVLRERDQRGASFRCAAGNALSQGRDRRSRDQRVRPPSTPI